ncbi:hypothetical protein BDN72DRAFT_965053 [Pluteus cervinus]|uniref:Uncharacterized protein n=1 Tax=Pluteus cervinus TaxID=181527 RepID=A0ACD3A704_9AGAR|nr:hypothetical protein BDN72DRAFT_965053 [Pluteus cervinus]
MPFSSLPLDVLIHLFSIVDGESLLKCREVCRTFSTLISNDIGLQYKLELYHSGMINDPTKYSKISTNQRLESLRTFLSRPQRWAETWPEETILGTEGIGNFLEWLWVYDSKLLACLTTAFHLRCFEFGPPGSVVPYRQWDVTPEPHLHRPKSLSIDQKQDLLVLADSVGVFGASLLRIHILSLSGGSPHPNAMKPFIEIRKYVENGFTLSLESRIYENLLAIGISQAFISQAMEIAIFDWTTGERLGVILGSEYMFFDTQHILLGRPHPEQNHGVLEIHSIGRSQPLIVLLLGVPRPLHLLFGKNTSARGVSDQYSFTSDPDLTMITCSLRYHSTETQILCIFPAFVIRNLLEESCQNNDDDTSETPMEIPWGTWPQCTFIWPVHSQRAPIYTAGNRVASSHHNKDEEETLMIYQFHPRWIRHPMTFRDLGQDNLHSGLDSAPVLYGMERIETVPLPKPEMVITTGRVDKVWMDDGLLVVVQPAGVTFARA